MSQTFKDRLQSIVTWMRETETTVSSQDSFNPDALRPEEINVIYDSFMEVLEVELRTKPLAIMIKSTKLLMIVTGNLVAAREKLSNLLESLLSNIISFTNTDMPREMKQMMMNEFLIIFENCMSDNGALEHLLAEFSPNIFTIVGNVNVAFFVRTDLLKSLNKYLVKIPMATRKAVFDRHGLEFEALVDCLFNCGDYDMQATIVETLLRCTTKSVRHKMVSAWFPNYVKLQSLFLGIGSKDFESDCRNFLVHFNEGLSDQKLVWSFPMMFCTVEGQALVKPEDLSEFWIDFNLGPGTVSFYYVFKEECDQAWHLFTLTKAKTTKIQTKYEQGRWKVLISCSSEGKADIIFEFNQPRDIPVLLRTMFSPLNIEEDNQKFPRQSISGKTLLVDTHRARTKAIGSLPEIQSIKKFVKVRKESMSGHLKAPDCSASEGLSDLPAAQPQDAKSPSSELSPALAYPKKHQGFKIKKLAKASLSKSIEFMRKSKFSRSGQRACGNSSSQDSNNDKKEVSLTRKAPVIKRKNSVPKLTDKKSSVKPSRTGRATKASSKLVSETSRVPAAEKDKVASPDKETDIPNSQRPQDPIPIHSSEVSRNKANDVEVPAKAGSQSMVVEPSKPKESSPALAVSRLSYSGRRVRAQRMSLKRKSEDVTNIVRKKLCFEQPISELHGKDEFVQEPVESDINPTEAPIDLNYTDNAGDNLVSVDMDITRAEEPVQEFKDKLEEINTPAEPLTHDEGVSVAAANTDKLDQATKEDDPACKGRPKRSKKRKSGSVKFLFTDSRMEESEPEAGVSEAKDTSLNSLAKEKIPTYAETHKKPMVKVKALSQSIPRRSPRKLGFLDAGFCQTGSKKFFKTKSQDYVLEIDDIGKAKKKRSYQRRTSPKSKTTAPSDPYSILSPSPKAKRGPPRASYGTAKSRRKTGSKRRSEKLFSDESDKESVQPQQEVSKSFPDYVIVNQDAGGDSANNSLNVNFKSRKTPSTLKKLVPKNAPKSTMKYLDNIVGLIDNYTEFVDGVSKIVLKDISYFITEKCDMLVLNQNQ